MTLIMEMFFTRIEGKIDSLSERIDGADKRVANAHMFICGILVLILAALLASFAKNLWEFYFERPTPAITPEDIRRVITETIRENNAKLKG